MIFLLKFLEKRETFSKKYYFNQRKLLSQPGRVLDRDILMTVTQNHRDVLESLKRQSHSARNPILHTYRSQISRGVSYRVPKVRARESRFAPRVLGLASHYRETLSRKASRKERADPFHVSRIHEASPLWPRVMTARSLCLCRENAVSAATGFTHRLFPVRGPIRTSSGCTSVPRARR